MDLYFLTICLVAVASVHAERIKIHTPAELMFDYFPLATNHLEFSVKSNSCVFVVLTNTHNLDSAYYKIELGTWTNSKAALFKDTSDARDEYTGAILKPNEFQTFWINLNETSGEIVVGKLIGGPFLRYTDESFVRMSYFGISTDTHSVGEWYFDTKMLCESQHCAA